MARRSAPIVPMNLKADRPKLLILTLWPCQVSCGSGEKVIYFQGSGEQALAFGDLGSRGNGQLGKQYSFRETHRVGPYPDDQGHTRAWAIKFVSFSFCTVYSDFHKVLDLYFLDSPFRNKGGCSCFVSSLGATKIVHCAVNRTQPCDVILSKTVTSCCHDLSGIKTTYS